MCSTSSRSSESVEHDKLLIGRPPLLSSSLPAFSHNFEKAELCRNLRDKEDGVESGRKGIRRKLAHRIRLRSHDQGLYAR
jgi:hypothetical protein